MPIWDDLRLTTDAPPPVETGVRRAAVAAIFGPRDELLFIQRAERQGDIWSGHMAFPGGREEPHDGSLEATAIRETVEEIGLDLSGARRLGRLTPLASPRNAPIKQLTVVPYVFVVPEWPELRPNEEVAGITMLSVHRLLAGEARGSFVYPWQGADLNLPCVRLDGTLLWGMTLKMVDELLDGIGRR